VLSDTTPPAKLDRPRLRIMELQMPPARRPRYPSLLGAPASSHQHQHQHQQQPGQLGAGHLVLRPSAFSSSPLDYAAAAAGPDNSPGLQFGLSADPNLAFFAPDYLANNPSLPSPSFPESPESVRLAPSGDEVSQRLKVLPRSLCPSRSVLFYILPLLSCFLTHSQPPARRARARLAIQQHPVTFHFD
jgi:hypothetical protein